MANTRFRSLGFWVLVVLIFVGEASLSWAQVESNPVVVRATKHVVVPPLSQIGRISAESERSTPLLDDDMLLMHERRATRPVRDSVLQQSSAATTFSALVSSSNIPSTNPGLNILGEGTGFPGYTVNNNTSQWRMESLCLRGTGEPDLQLQDAAGLSQSRSVARWLLPDLQPRLEW